jgi:heptosyltransferase-2
MNRILVRAPNWIGDQLLAYPFYYFLRRQYPVAHIAVSCAPWVESIQFHRLINEVVPLAKPLGTSFVGRFQALGESARRLRERGPWDLGISLPNSLSAAWLLYRAGAERRRGFGADARSPLLTEALDWKAAESLHRSDAYLKLLEPEGVRASGHDFWGVPPVDEDDPADLGRPGVLARFDAAAEWPDAVAVEPPDEPYWVLAPGSTAESRRWPLERARALAEMIHARTGLRGLVVGGPSETVAATQLSDEREAGLSNWTARGNVAANWKLLARARFVVSNDSGLAHMASLCGTPVFIAWGAGNPRHTEPVGPGRARLSFNPVECWPCEKNVCFQPAGRRLQCLNGIQPDTLWSNIQKELARDAQAAQRTP